MLERLQKEMVKALKEGNKFRKLTLSTLISAVKKAGIDAGCRENIPDEMVIQVLKKEKKNSIYKRDSSLFHMNSVAPACVK